MSAPLPIVQKLGEGVTIGYHDDGYANIGTDKDGNTISKSRPATPMTRLANRDGSEAAALIAELYGALLEAHDWVWGMERRAKIAALLAKARGESPA